nr:unnamed protein product [Digitaria exilis]
MGFLDGAAMDRTFAVELDTYRNAELRDIDSNHAGVHVGGLFSTDSHAAAFHDDSHGGGALTGLSLDSGEAMQAWVDYDGMSKRVNVTLAPMGVAKPSTPLLSDVSDDLSAVLTERAYVGFSAATGPIKTRHCVLAWSFAMDGPARPIDFTKMPKLPRSGRSNKTLKTMALPIAAASALVLLATCAITLLLWRRRRLKYAELREDWEVEFGPHRFSYKDLFHATGGFKSNNILGAGGFGKVYKGIIKDVASAVFYLHEKWEQVVIHRDIKASNVLLDGGMTAHLGDFGLARLHDHGADLQATTHVVGTMGYIAPELARTGRASPLTDVFAFGVFLLEVACGRQPVSNGGVRHGRRTLLVDRVLECWRAGELLETVDARLRGGYDADEARLVLTLGLMCSHPFPGERPAMRQVVQCLDGDAPLPELTPADLSLLTMMQNEGLFDRRCLWSSENSIGTMSIDISVGR